MKKPRIYIDTSVIGGCLDDEFAPWSNGLMRDFRLGRFRPVVSQILADELAGAPDRVKDVYADLLTLDHDFLEVTDEVSELAELYQKRGILTAKYFYDGVHIALAALANVDIVVSWNFRHIVHFDKIRLFNAVNVEHGYHQLQIYSPRQVTSYGEQEEDI